MCLVNQYNVDGNCKYCSRDCEICTGPNPADCKKCFPKLCPTSHGCGKCKDNADVSNPNQQQKEKESSSDETVMSNFMIYFVIAAFSTIITVFLCVIIFVLSCLLIRKTAFFYYLQGHNTINRNRNGGPLVDYNEDIPDKIYYKSFPSKVSEGNLLLTQKIKIGKGAAGDVYKCPYVENSDYIFVAVKIAKQGNKEALKEREILAELCHIHIIELLSFNMKENLILIMPLRKDNLKNFLIKEKEKISDEHQIRFCLQIADAFRYLSHKKFIHNDLKASNILVVNCKHIEVSDFGKSEALINMKRIVGTITHTAIELLDKMKFPTASSSEKTDVWSFGVTVWEIFNCCLKNPYDDEIREKNKDKILNQAMIIEYLWKGQRLIPPQIMHQQLQTTIISCWSNDFLNRPSFNDLFDTFLKALPECHGLPQVKRPNNEMLPPLFAF